MKYFRMSYEEVVFKRSYLTIMLLNRSIPSYNTNNKESEYGGGRSKKSNKNKVQKELHEIDKTQHANDFFMGMM